MVKVKVEVLKAVVDGKTEGETLSIEKKTAEHLESIGYVRMVSASKKADEKEGGE